MTRHTLVEHGSLPLGAGGLSHVEARALVRAASRKRARVSAWHGEASGHAGAEDEIELIALGPDTLRARQHVGQVIAGGVSLEILPKIGHLSDAEARGCLVRMLAVAFDIEILVGSATPHGYQDETLLDILIRQFAAALAEQVRRGLPRAYLHHAEDRAALRGKLDVGRQFTTLLAAPQRIACSFDELSPDIALNRIMAAAVRFLRPLARTIETQRLLAGLAFAYADFGTEPIVTLPWGALRFNRSNSRWRALAEFARLLLDRSWQTTGRGETGGTALLFDMNRLFERYIARRLILTLPSGWTMSAQGERRWCVTAADSPTEGVFQAQPDIVLLEAGKPRLVIDTKWKRLAAYGTDRKRGIAQGDVYQMMAYAALYDAPVLLLYPWHASCGGEAGHRLACYRIEGVPGGTISAGTVDVARSNVAAQLLASRRLQCDRLVTFESRRRPTHLPLHQRTVSQ